MTTPTHPLIARLLDQYGYPLATADNLEPLLGRPGHTLVFCGGDPTRHPECLDVAVVLPELVAAFPGLLAAVVADPAVEPVLQARYGFQLWPTLVLLRDGEYLGAIGGMQDWPIYMLRLAELLAAPTRRPPSVGIPVAPASQPATCH